MHNNSFFTVIKVDNDIDKISNDLRRLGASAYVSKNEISVFCPGINRDKVAKARKICENYPVAETA